MPFAELMQRLREQAGLSQSQLARKAGVPVRSVQNWEQGHRLPRPQALLPLATALGVPVEKLIRSMAEGGQGDALPVKKDTEVIKPSPAKKRRNRKEK